MRRLRWVIAVPAVAITAAACSGREQPKVDDGLSRDLSLAASAQAAPPQQVVSPMEMGYQQQPYPQQQGYAPAYPQGYYPAPQQVPVVYRSGYPAPAPAPRRTASRASSGTVYSGPVRSEPVRHTKRDALIGVAAGTIAGAAIGHDTKGALIGAAAGGLIGAAVGHSIDVGH